MADRRRLLRGDAGDDVWQVCQVKGIGSSRQGDERERVKVQKRGIQAGIDGCVKAGALAFFTLDDDQLVYWRPDRLGAKAGSKTDVAMDPTWTPNPDPNGSNRVQMGPTKKN